MNQINAKQLINVDNLEINFKGVIPLTAYDCTIDETKEAKRYHYNPNVWIEYTTSRTPSYNHIANLFINCRCIGEIKF